MRVDDENAGLADPDLLVGVDVCAPVAEASIVGTALGEQVQNISQACRLESIRHLQYNLSRCTCKPRQREPTFMSHAPEECVGCRAYGGVREREVKNCDRWARLSFR